MVNAIALFPLAISESQKIEVLAVNPNASAAFGKAGPVSTP
jgi:hypothetical protein